MRSVAPTEDGVQGCSLVALTLSVSGNYRPGVLGSPLYLSSDETRTFFFFFYLWWILSYIEMKQPRVYMCSPSQSPLPPPETRTILKVLSSQEFSSHTARNLCVMMFLPHSGKRSRGNFDCFPKVPILGVRGLDSGTRNGPQRPSS